MLWLAQGCLIFSQRSFFIVQRELAAMAENERPLILLHEGDVSRGGAPIEQLMQASASRECPRRPIATAHDRPRPVP